MTYTDIQITIRLQALVRAWREFLEQIDTCTTDTMDNLEFAQFALDRVIHAKEPWGLQELNPTKGGLQGEPGSRTCDPG